MSVTCNVRVTGYHTPNTVVDSRRKVAKKAASSAIGAIADVLFGLELLENDQPPHAVAVYFASANQKLETAREGYAEMRAVLERFPTSPEVLSWRETLDYAAIYESGVKERLIPTGQEAWRRITSLCTDERSPVFAPIDAVIADIDTMRSSADALAKLAEQETGLGSLSTATVQAALRLQSLMGEFLTFFRQLVYLNAIKPDGSEGGVEPDDANVARASSVVAPIA